MDKVSLPDLCLRLAGATVYPFIWLACPKLAFPCAIPGKAHLKDILYNLPEKRASFLNINTYPWLRIPIEYQFPKSREKPGFSGTQNCGRTEVA